MAADILIYRSDVVPVGKDQKQHLEITRDIAVKFNQTYCPKFDAATGKGGVLTLPEPMIMEEAAVVPGLDGQKMSKSYNNTIELFAPDKETQKKIMSIKTDSTPVEAPKNPDTDNIFALLKHFASPQELAAIREQYVKGGVGYGEFKKKLVEFFMRQFGEARKKRLELEKNTDYAVSPVYVRMNGSWKQENGIWATTTGSTRSKVTDRRHRATLSRNTRPAATRTLLSRNSAARWVMPR
jgi:tryptophanyl-tRNA synthetase